MLPLKFMRWAVFLYPSLTPCKAAALVGQSSIPSQTVWSLEPLDLKRLLLLLVPVVLADPAIAFDGGGFEAEEKMEVPTDQSKTKTLAKYSEFHQSCMDIQMTMWGEVAELMEDLATAHCYCEYTKLESLETVFGLTGMMLTLHVPTKALLAKRKPSSCGLFPCTDNA